MQSGPEVPRRAARRLLDLMLGEPTIAIGNPFGLNQSVSIGVVSALHRPVHAEDRSYYDFIQTDASINPGNSGGPLLNADGNVIGVCSAVLASGQGIGFAIPIDRALRVARELRRAARWRMRGGDRCREAGQGGAAALGAKTGALITPVEEGSPADKAGLRRGDADRARRRNAGARRRRARFLLRDVPLGNRVTRWAWSAEGSAVDLAHGWRRAAPPERALGIFETRSGLSVVELSARDAREAGYDVQKPLLRCETVARGSVRRRGWACGRATLVISVNSAEVDTLKDFEKALGQARKSGQAVLLVQRGYRTQEFAFDLG